MGRRARAVAALAIAAAAVTLCAAQELTPREAAAVEQKLIAVMARSAAHPSSKAAPSARTSFSEREVNAYLRFSVRDQLPDGVQDPQLTLVGDRRLSGRAIVNLDAVRTAKPRGWLDPASYLTGIVEVHAVGVLQTAGGRGTFQLESASVGSLPIPKSLVQELVSYYSRSADLPAGFDLDKPFDLPASIREVEIQRGAATIVQ